MRLPHHIGVTVFVSMCLTFQFADAFTPLRAQDITEFRKINEAERLATTGDPAKAAAALRDLLKHHKNYQPTLWYYLGVALSREGDLENARKAFKKAVDGNPFFGRIGLARTYLLAKQFEQAEKEGRQILPKEAKTANTHYVFAILHFFSGDPGAALTEIEASIKEDPSFAPALLLKYQIFLLSVTRTGPPEIDRAERIRQLMIRSAQSLQAYLALNPAEQNNDFLLDQLHAINVYAESVPDLSSPGHLFSVKEVTTKARVLHKPEPQYTEAARKAQIIGSVVLRLVFSASGRVEHILVVKPLPFGLTEESIKAAKQIKFTPATRDGKPVSMVMEVEYNFNLY